MRTNQITIIICTAMAFAGQLSPAATPVETPELINARETQLRELQRVSVPILSNYLRELEKLKFQYARAAKLDEALAVSNEIEAVTKQLDSAKRSAERTGAAIQLVILSATYETLDQRKKVDITKQVRKAYDAGVPTLKMNTEAGAAGQDPAPFQKKQTTVKYMIRGQRKEKVFPEGTTMNFKEDLE